MLKFFTFDEFDSPDKPGSGLLMHGDFLRRLDMAREAAGLPFVVTSGYRTAEHNQAVGGVEGSAHTRGWAADISLADLSTADQLRIVAELSRVGIRRIGIAPGRFVHADTDPTKPIPAYWSYEA